MKPQTLATLELLRRHPVTGVTPIEAREAVGTDRLAARIAELRAAGHDIETQTWRTPTGKHVARYVLHESPVMTGVQVEAFR